MVKKHSSPNTKRGFTMIEVILFIAISGALLIALAGTLTSNIHVQRYKDTVNDLAEYLHRVYSDVTNVQNIREEDATASTYCSIASMWNDGVIVKNNNATETEAQNYPGRSDCIIYGKAITFGERGDDQDGQRIYEYDVIGTIYNGRYHDKKSAEYMTYIGNGSISSLMAVGADVVTVRGNAKGDCNLNYAGNYISYSLQWGGWVEDAEGGIRKGTILITRSPLTGSVETYYYNDSIPVQNGLEAVSGMGVSCDSNTALTDTFYKFSDDFLHGVLPKMKQEEIFLCVDSDDRSGIRRAVQIAEKGNNASAVEVATDEVSAEVCK